MGQPKFREAETNDEFKVNDSEITAVRRLRAIKNVVSNRVWEAPHQRCHTMCKNTAQKRFLLNRKVKNKKPPLLITALIALTMSLSINKLTN